MSRVSLHAHRRSRRRFQFRRELQERFYRPRTEPLEKRLLLATDVFPATEATLILAFNDPIAGQTEIIDLSGPTEVLREENPSNQGFGDPALDEVGLQIEVFDLAGDHPALGAVSLRLPQPGTPTQFATSGGFVEEGFNVDPAVLEAPFFSQLAMFVQVDAQSTQFGTIQGFNQEPIVLSADLNELPPGPGVPYVFSGGQPVELLDSQLQPLSPRVFVIGVTHTVQPLPNSAPDPPDATVNLAENSPNNTSVHTVAPNDPDPRDTHTFDIVGGNQEGVFQIDTTTGEIAVVDNTHLDHEWFPSFDLQIEVTDNGGLTGSANVTVNVGDVNDAPVARDDHQFFTTEDLLYDSTLPDFLKVPAGFDVVRTPPNVGGTTSDFVTQADINLPAGFFGDQNGTPSDPIFIPLGTPLTFVGEPGNVVGFEPSPVVIFENCHENPGGDHLHCIEPLPPGADLHEADTVIERLDDLVLPGIGDSGTTQIQIVGLSLVSINPINVTYGAEPPQNFDIFVGLDGAQATGQMTLTRTTPTGGTWDSQLPVDFQIVFENQDDRGPMAAAPVGGFSIPGDLQLVGGQFDVSSSVLANDTDQDGTPLTILGVNGTANLTGVSGLGADISLDPNGNLTYDPSGVAVLQALTENDQVNDTFTYTISDGGIQSDAIVNVTVIGVNDPPEFTAGPDQVVNELDGPQTIVDWATGIRPGPVTPIDEPNQNVSFVVSNDNNGLFASQPAVSSSGTLTFEPAPNTTGVAQVTITAVDDGSGTPPNVNTSADQSFTIQVNKGEVDAFPRTVGQVVVQIPGVGTELITTAGPSKVHVFFDGTAEGDALDDDGNNRDEVVSELVQADFDGFHPLLGPVQIRLRDDQRSLGQIEELVNNIPGWLDIDPFAPGAADSFFDVFFEIFLPASGQTLVTAEPTRVQSVIDNKPPQDGERYIFNPPQPVELIDKATGLGTGIFIVREIHDEDPTVEPDRFPRTIGQVVIELPDGSTELITTAGPSGVDVYFEGPAEGDATDDDGDGLDEVVSELVQADFDGFHPLLGPVQIRLRDDLPSLGQITEQVNNNPGLLDVDPFAPGNADSFFDVFFEITLPASGQTLVTAEPTRVQSVIDDKPPQDGERYIFNPPQPVELIDKATGLGTGIFIVREIHNEDPTIEEDIFSRTTASITLIDLNSGAEEEIDLLGPATVHVYFEGDAEGDAVDDDGDGLEEVASEIVALNLTGSSSFGVVNVRQRTDVPSLGLITELANNTTGLLDVDPFAPGDADSFFDVFFEIEVNGNTLIALQPKRMQTIITEKPPGLGDTYESPEIIELFDAITLQPTGLAIGRATHTPRPLSDSIHGIKFEDVDADGIYDPLIDRLFPGVRIGLLGDANGDGTNELTVTRTDAGGEYAFVDLASGPFTVVEFPPDGTVPTTNILTNVVVSLGEELVAIAGQANLRPGQVEVVLGAQLMFGNTVLGSIHGLKFEDIDANGLYDPSIDIPMPGVRIELQGDRDGNGVPEISTATTDQDGEYQFVQLFPGPYEVAEIPSQGTMPTTATSTSVFVFSGEELVALPGQAVLGPFQEEVLLGAALMFGNKRPGSIHGYKFEDLNADGLETQLLQTETIVLRTGQDARGNPIKTPGSLDANITYFTNKSSGPLTPDFAAAEIGPAAELVIPNSAWISPSSFPDPDARWINWNHSPIGNGSGRPPASVLYAQPFVVDTDHIASAELDITWAVDDQLGDSGTMGVFVNQTPLNISGGSFASATTVLDEPITVMPGLNWLYVYQQDVTAVVSGLIYSATIDVTPMTDPRLEGVTIELQGDDGSTRTTTTMPGGEYWFENLPTGVTYNVTEVAPSGSKQTTPDPAPIFLLSGQEYVADDAQAQALINGGLDADRIVIDPDLSFGNAFDGSIHGLKFNDANSNGRLDSGEAFLSGVTINISGDDGSTDTTLTMAGGHYWFEDLMAGVTYTVTETPPAGSIQTTPDPAPRFVGSGIEWVARREQKQELINGGHDPMRVGIDPDLAFGNAFEIIEVDVFENTTAQLLLELPLQPGLITTNPELPPTDGEYRSPSRVHAEYQGADLLVVLRDIRHRAFANPAPQITIVGNDEQEDFQSSLTGTAIITSASLGLDQVAVPIDLTGPVQTLVRGKANNTSGAFLTEIVQMELSGDVRVDNPAGGDLFIPIIVQASPTQPSQGEVEITDLGGGTFAVDSFFDVFTEISVDGGASFVPSTDSTRVDLVQPGILTPQPDLPPTDGVYRTPERIHAEFQGPDLLVILGDVRHRAFADPRPQISVVGDDEQENFQSSLVGTALITSAALGLDNASVPVELSGPVQTLVDGKGIRSTGSFDTEIVSMSLSGNVQLPDGSILPLVIQESPSESSTGEVTITDLDNGQFNIDSFFDVFTELSVDGGATFIPATESTHVELAPPPQLVTLTGPATVHVFFEGPNEGDADDNDGDNLDEVQTEIVSLQLSGTTPLGPVKATLRSDRQSLGQIEEQVDVNTGVLDVEPFTQNAVADSFFDVWTEITVGGRVLHTTLPLRLETPIHHKPPQDGERYVNPFLVRVQLIDPLTGEGTGIFVLREIHQPDPTTEVDVFEDTLASITLIDLNSGAEEEIDLRGPATVHVFFEGADEGDAVDDDGDGLEEVSTEIVSLDLTGNSTLAGGPVHVRHRTDIKSLGRITELVNNTAGTLDIDPFAPGDADSFFDVFFEIEVGGQTFITAQPKRMRTIITEKPPGPGDTYFDPNIIELLDPVTLEPTGLAIGSARHTPKPPIEVDVFPDTVAQLLLELPTQGGIVTPRPDLPPTDGVYRTAADVHAEFQGPDLEIILQDIRHRAFTSPRPQISNQGRDEIESFQSSLVGTAIVTLAGLGLDAVPVPVELDGPVQTIVYGKADRTDGTFATEIVSMDLRGDVRLPGGEIIALVIREDVGKPSRGQVTIAESRNGEFSINSFFDVFTELSVDGGQNFIPAADAARVELAPPPQLVTLTGPATVHVFFEGHDEGDARDDDGDNLDEVQTEIVSLDLTGTTPLGPVEATLRSDLRSTGQIEEQVDVTTGVLDVDPFTQNTVADSFFDVWTEITINGRVLQTAQPLRLETPINHKPPRDGERYVNPFLVRVELIDPLTGQGTGIFILREIHQPDPTTEVDVFDNTFAKISLIELATGAEEVVNLEGPATVHVFFEGANEGDARDDDGDGLEEVQTEIVSLNLTGTSSQGAVTVRNRSDVASLGQITELVNNTSGLLDVDPFAPGDADSFFDVFFEIEVGGNTFVTAQPKRMRTIITEKPPGTGDSYFDPNIIELLDPITLQPTGLAIGSARHTPRPPIEIDKIEETTGLVQLVGGPLGNVPVPFILRGSSEVHVFFEGAEEGDARDDDGNNLDDVDTELVQLDLTDGNITLSLNPNQTSLGQIEELLNNTPGLLDLDPFADGDADSFFDVFFQIDVGGGLVLHNNQALRIQAVISEKPPIARYFHIIPPAGGIELFDANNDPSGVFIVKAEHYTGFVERDVIEETTGLVQLVGGPLGAEPVPFVLRGSSVVDVFFEGREGDARDDDGNNRDEVETELVSLSLTDGSITLSLNPNQASLGQIEEQLNKTVGLLDLDPFADGDADSFFDVFFQIDVGGGVVVHNGTPLRIEAVISEKPPIARYFHIIPPAGPIELLDANDDPSGVFIVSAEHYTGHVEVDELDSGRAEIELINPDGTSELIKLTGSSRVHVFFERAEGRADDDDGDRLDEVETEMVSLRLTGTSSLGPVEVRLNPNMRSLGEIEELRNRNPGLLDLDPFARGDALSFFDVFFEIQVGDLVLHNDEPKRMSTILREKPPGPGEVYEDPERIPLLDSNGNDTGFALGASRHIPNSGNKPPLAADDTHRVRQGGTLVVAAPGVLANDSDPENDPLKAGNVIDAPVHATSFSLNDDGSFTYVHDGSATAFDTFTYVANDGTLDSNVATVTIRIDAVEVDAISPTTALIQLQGGPIGAAPVPFVLRGSSEVHVFFEGPNEGDASDDDGNALDEVETELVSLNLTDGNVTLRIREISKSPFGASLGEIEERVNNTPGTLDIDPFERGVADSFFDVFFEIELADGTIVHNNQPLRIEAVITSKPPIARYIHILPSEGGIELFNENNESSGVRIVKAEHYTGFIGIDQPNNVFAEVTIRQADGKDERVRLNGSSKVHTFFERNVGDALDDDNDELDEVQTEIVALSLTGRSEVGPVEVRLRPGTSSLGEVEEAVNNNPGIIDLPPLTQSGVADSFFDIFVEVEVDGQILHTADPIRFETQVSNVPPKPGVTYRSASREPIPLLDANDNPTGLSLVDPEFTPQPLEVINPPGGGNISVRVVDGRIVVTTADGVEHDFPADVARLLLRILGAANETDSLNIDLRGLLPGTRFDFDGRGGDGDSLHLRGGGPNLTVTHQTTTPEGFRGSATDGNVTTNFLGITPLTLLDSTPEQVTINLPPVTDSALLQRLTDGGGQFQVSSPTGTFEQTLVEIPSNMFLLNAGDGDDLVTLEDSTGAAALGQTLMVHGNEGNDTIDASGFPNLVGLFGDVGDDVFQFAAPMFDKLEGGDGTDAVELLGDGGVLDITALAADQLTSVERFDIEGSGANLLRVSTSSVEALAGAGGALDVLSNADDTVEFGSGWAITGTEVRDDRFYRIIEQTGGGTAIVNLSGPLDWRNPLLRVDVNNDGSATARDALNVINELAASKFHAGENDRQLFDAKTVAPFPLFFFDVNGSGTVTALDALQVINFLPSVSGQGEALQIVDRESVGAPNFDSSAARYALRVDHAFTPNIRPLDTRVAQVIGDFAESTETSKVAKVARDSAKQHRISQSSVGDIDSLWRKISAAEDMNSMLALLADQSGVDSGE